MELRPLPPRVAGANPQLISTLETVAIASKDRRVTWWTTNLVEAPNWSRDGAHLHFNRRGRIHHIPPPGGEPRAIDAGFATRDNNDHGWSPDSRKLAFVSYQFAD